MIEVNMVVEDQQFECFLSIQYPLMFKKGHIEVQVLINSDSKVNAMTSIYTTVLWLRVCPTDVGPLKIDKSMLLTYSIVLANF